MTICFHTFGCKLNQAETQALKEKFKNQDWQITRPGVRADVHVINSCVVTQKAEKEVRQIIHQIKRQDSNAFLVVIGCYTSGLKVKEKQSVDLWIDNSEKERTDELILEKLYSKRFGFGISDFEKFNSFKDIQKRIGQSRTRALIKIQSGCQHYCTYCIVPFVRKKVSSRSARQVIQEIKQKQEQGRQEVVLVGTNIGQYKGLLQSDCNRHNRQRVDIVSLLKEILKQTTVPRIRLSSIWPTRVNSELIKLIKNNSRICPHFHLSIQSASDKILKRMNREYTQEDLKRIIKKIYRISKINLTADIIVGFPGEKDSDFQRTLKLVQWARFLKVHVFRFSSRPNTKAWLFKDQVLEKTKQVRSKKLIKLSELVGQKQKNKFIGQVFPVLIEAKQGRYWQGLTSNYLKVFVHPVRGRSPEGDRASLLRGSASNGVQSNKDLSNQIIKVKLLELYQDGMIGEIDS